MTPSEAPQDRPAVRRRAQFSIRMMMVVMLLVCVAVAVYGGLVRGGADRRVFLIIGAAAPMGVMIVLSLFRKTMRMIASRKRR